MIRPYQQEDKPLLIELCREFWNASCVENFGEFSESHTAQKLDHYLENGVCLVTKDIKGFILLVESTNLCNPNPIAAEVAWYVSPLCRGGLGVALLKAAIRYCEIKNIKTLSMMYMQSSMPESIVKIYDKMGLTLSETTYIKRF